MGVLFEKPVYATREIGDDVKVKCKGIWVKNRLHGTGECIWPDGATYKGEFKNGMMYGRGEATYPSGASYKGVWKNDVPYGYGKHTYDDGQTYVGDFQSGVENGMGVITYPTGEVFEGSFVDGRKHGNGVRKMPDGKEFKGKWFRGKCQVDTHILDLYKDKVHILNKEDRKELADPKSDYNTPAKEIKQEQKSFFELLKKKYQENRQQ